jgi:uncharacterized protein with HEPN domain
MRPEPDLLRDIIESASAIVDAIGGLTYDDFVRVRLVRSSVMFEFIVLGEAAGKLSDELLARHADVPWSEIIGFRHVIVHGYYRVQWPRAWQTAVADVPVLLARAREILATEFPTKVQS